MSNQIRFPATVKACNDLCEDFNSYEDVPDEQKQILKEDFFLSEPNAGEFIFDNMANKHEILQDLLVSFMRSVELTPLVLNVYVKHIANYKLEKHLQAVITSAIEDQLEEMFNECASSNINSALQNRDSHDGWAA